MNDKKKLQEKVLPQYEVPQVITYTDEEILEELGPAQTVTSGFNGTSVM